PYRFTGYRSLIQGQPCLVGIGLDRTESRKAEKDRQASQERYQLLAEVTHDAIWDYQLEEDLIAWNRGFSRLTGFEDTGPAVTFAGWSQLLHPEESQEVLGSLSQAMRAGVANWSREHRFARQDGSYAWVLNRAYLIQDESGKLVRLIAGAAPIHG
ncbi:MAG TPA: PAS domain-containing protein, partial [Candidatus Obscuribacter sp.]|nr:PAS domain-containing protein [Candidatus Obscuribacter sp.]